MESSFSQVKAGALGIALVLVLSATLTANSFVNVFETPRFLVVLSFLVILNLRYVIQKEVIFIPKDRCLRYSLVAILFFLLVSFLNSIAGPRVGAILLVFMWLFLVFNLATLIKKQKLLPFLQQVFILQSPFVLLVFLIFLNNEVFDRSTMRPFFGNPNTCGNYVALSMLSALWYLLLEVSKKEPLRIIPIKIQKLLSLAILLVGAFLLVSFQSRGAILGFSFAAFVLLLSKKKIFFSRKQILVAGSVVIVFGLSALLYLKGYESLEYRYSYWRNTLCMIQENPLGVGPGAFRYVFEAYSGKCYPEREAGETLILTHPHNLFLEIFAEGGVFVGILFLFLLAYIGLQLKSFAKTHSSEVTWIVSHALFLATIGFFEFPQHTPYVYFVMSFVVAVALSFFKMSEIPRMAQINFFLVALTAVLLTRKAYAELVFKQPLITTYTDNYRKACELNDEDWELCSRLAYRYLYKKDFSEAERIILKLSPQYEKYSRFINLKGDYYFLRGDLQQACREFRAYDRIFYGSSEKASFIQENCSMDLLLK